MATRGIRTEKAPAPVQGAPYQQGVAATPGEVLWVSGQVPLDPATGALASDGIATSGASSRPRGARWTMWSRPPSTCSTSPSSGR